MGIIYIFVLTQKVKGIYGYYLLIVVDTESKRKSIRYFYIFLLTQKVKGIYQVYLLIVVDTKRKRNI